ncbi:MAG: aquaporin Z [Alphaproteobacteria bacterium]|nr:aquaporin Z [Alphaproteobacteria bacterium]
MKNKELTMRTKLAAEFLGTFVLVFGGCGSALIAAGFPDLGIGFVGVALAFGLTVLTMAYAVGAISGGHFNPAVSIGLATAGRFDWKDVGPYVITQVIGGAVAACVLAAIVSGRADFSTFGGFASNGYGDLSPGNYSMLAAFLTETILTGFFLIVILGATSARAVPGFAPIAIGLALTLIHLISIPVTNTSVNPARSTAVALVTLFETEAYFQQLWMFWVAPILGAVLGALTYKKIFAGRKS